MSKRYPSKYTQDADSILDFIISFLVNIQAAPRKVLIDLSPSGVTAIKHLPLAGPDLFNDEKKSTPPSIILFFIRFPILSFLTFPIKPDLNPRALIPNKVLAAEPPAISWTFPWLNNELVKTDALSSPIGDIDAFSIPSFLRKSYETGSIISIRIFPMPSTSNWIVINWYLDLGCLIDKKVKNSISKIS